jgi:hypothetical protein
MKPRNLPIDLAVLDLCAEIFYTLAGLRAYPFLSAQVAQFESLYPECMQLMQEELALLLEQYEVDAQAIVLDDIFDFLCVAISASLLAQTGGNRKSPIYQRYFGAAPPSKLKRPVLGQQLEVMRMWPPSLMGPDSEAPLQEYGKQLAERVIDADKVVLRQSEIARKQADFAIGPRQAFIEKVNALRQSLYGQLSEMPLKHPEHKLRRDFANRFFLRDESGRKPSIAELEQTIFRLRERLGKHEDQLARLIEEEENEELLRQNTEIAAAEAELAEIEKRQSEAAERLAALRTKGTKQKP